MKIELRKFGEILTSREAGGEALAAFKPTLNNLEADENIIIDFNGVSVLAPSWADEFIRPILEKYGDRVSFQNDENPSVKAALKFANPNLDLSKITVFEDKLVFDEKSGFPEESKNSWLILTFPYNDDDAVKILEKNKIKEIRLIKVDNLSAERLRQVKEMLKEKGIKGILSVFHK